MSGGGTVWWRRWLRLAPPDEPGRGDVGVPWRQGAVPLSGAWAQAYERCRQSGLGYDRVVATMDPGPVRERLAALRADLDGPLRLAADLASLGEHLSPGSPRRAGWFEGNDRGNDRSGDGSEGLGATPADVLVEHLDRLRVELDELADAAARIAVQLLDEPAATDVPALLGALADGLLSAVRSGYVPSGLQPEGSW